MKKFKDFKLNEKWVNNVTNKKEMNDSIYNMYSEYIDDNNLSNDNILDFIYELIRDNPELLNNQMEKNN